MRRSWLLVAIPVVAAAIPSCATHPSSAGDLSYGSRGARVREEPYDVRGATAEELERDLAERGPLLEDRRRFAVTRWDLEWSVEVERGGAVGCAVEDALVESEIVVRLPEWRNASAAPAGLRADWRAFVRALRAHERGHRDRILVGAEALRRALERLRAPSCSDLHRRASDVARSHLETVDRANRAYDRATRSGATQGAVWPPSGGDG